jgi:hypothetical protein
MHRALFIRLLSLPAARRKWRNAKTFDALSLMLAAVQDVGGVESVRFVIDTGSVNHPSNCHMTTRVWRVWMDSFDVLSPNDVLTVGGGEGFPSARVWRLLLFGFVLSLISLTPLTVTR